MFSREYGNFAGPWWRIATICPSAISVRNPLPTQSSLMRFSFKNRGLGSLPKTVFEVIQAGGNWVGYG